MNRIPRKLKKKIPQGVYCYVFTGEVYQKWNKEHSIFLPVYKTKPCYFYSNIKCSDKPEQLQDEVDKEFPDEYIGWCKLNKHEIDDQCKSCGLKCAYKINR